MRHQIPEKRRLQKRAGPFAKIEKDGWGQLTSRGGWEHGQEMVKRGAEAVLDENQKLGLEVAEELGLTRSLPLRTGAGGTSPKADVRLCQAACRINVREILSCQSLLACNSKAGIC